MQIYAILMEIQKNLSQSGKHLIGFAWHCSFLQRHNPEFDWRNGELHFTRCPAVCSPQRHISICDEEINALGETRLEFESQDQYGQLDDDDWHDPDTFEHWLRYSDDPHAVHLRTFNEESVYSAGEASQENWSSLVPEEYHAYGTVFSQKASERMPTCKPYDHAINLKAGESLPKPAKLYPMSRIERNSLDEWIDAELAKGYIRTSKSPTAAPVFFVKKASHTPENPALRLVQDYRKLNSVTVPNKYPLPRIPDLIDSLSQASIFTSLDLRWGFNNVRIKEGDEHKAAFITHRGLYKPTVMYFGFCNAPSTFQAMMNDVLKEEIATGKVVVYIDNILIFTDNLIDHRALVHRVLSKLRDNDLFIKPEKCHFEQNEVKFLSLFVSRDTIRMDPKKISGVKDWPTPTRVKHVQAFLGFANFYRRFIQDFAKLSRPLTTLTCKDVPFQWGPEQEVAFNALKHAMCTAPILRIPDDIHPFRLESDSSDFATGAVLEQLGEDGIWHPVAFYSKSLNEHKRNYEIYDKELLAVIRALEEY
jgi:hypothetical protein